MTGTKLERGKAEFEGQTEVNRAGWRELPDVVTERIVSEVGDIEMHHFEADLWVDDEGDEYFEWKAEVKMLDLY